MVSREGEEAECHETESPLSTPPRMGSIKVSSDDPLQNRLSIESCQRIGRRSGEFALRNYDQMGSVNIEDKDFGKDSVARTVTIDTNEHQIMDDTEEVQTRLPSIPQIDEGNLSKNFS
jgi:hypothetical protein